MTFSVSKCSCQCACRPGNKKTAQAGNCKPGAGGRKKKRKFGGSVSDAVKAPEATLDLGKEPWTVHTTVLGMTFCESVLLFCDLLSNTKKVCPNCIKAWKTRLKQTHRAEFEKFDKFTAGLNTQSKPEHNDTHAKSKPGTLTYCVL